VPTAAVAAPFAQGSDQFAISNKLLMRQVGVAVNIGAVSFHFKQKRSRAVTIWR